MLHPDKYKNPTLVEDDLEKFEMLAVRQLCKLRELFEKAREDQGNEEDRKDLFYKEVNNKIFNTLKQAGGDKYVKDFNDLVDRYTNVGILNLKMILLDDIVDHFRKNKEARVLKLNQQFLNALKKVQVSDIQGLLKKECSFYVRFAEPYFKKSFAFDVNAPNKAREVEEHLDGCYFRYLPPNGESPANIGIMYTTDACSMAGLSMGVTIPIEEGKTFAESFSIAKSKDDAYTRAMDSMISKEAQAAVLKGFEDDIDIASAIVNACIYFHSMNPDVSHLEPEKDKKRRNTLAIKRGIPHEEISSYYPVTLLNWNYGRGREYTVDSTWVDSYLRWQRCGPGFTQVKLIMVSEHERHYRKDNYDDSRREVSERSSLPPVSTNHGENDGRVSVHAN